MSYFDIESAFYLDTASSLTQGLLATNWLPHMFGHRRSTNLGELPDKHLQPCMTSCQGQRCDAQQIWLTPEKSKRKLLLRSVSAVWGSSVWFVPVVSLTFWLLPFPCAWFRSWLVWFPTTAPATKCGHCWSTAILFKRSNTLPLALTDTTTHDTPPTITNT